jgi:hypothetical protein
MKEKKLFNDMKFSKANVDYATRVVKQIRSGCPPKYDADVHPVMLLLLFLEGKDIEAFCYAAEVHRAQFHRWVDSHVEFHDAYEHGKELARLWWVERAQRGIDDTSFNNTLWSMVMRNRFRFTEHRVVEVPNMCIAPNLKLKMDAISNAIAKGRLTGSEITYMTNYLNACSKVEEVTEILPRLEALEVNAHG